ncbi:MAG: hypothetical protein K8R37_06500 [Bacteroidales bacterium]|nr:hypothetical protein [Bacteroidales bacterium]
MKKFKNKNTINRIIFILILMVLSVNLAICQNDSIKTDSLDIPKKNIIKNNKDLSKIINVSTIYGSKTEKIELGNEFKITFLISDLQKYKTAYLYLNNKPVKQIEEKNISSISADTLEYIIKLCKKDVESIIDTTCKFLQFSQKAKIGIGSSTDNTGKPVNYYDIKIITDKNYILRWYFAAGFILIIIIICIFIKKHACKLLELIRDISSSENKPFSLSRTQFAYWTIIIILLMLLVWINKGELLSFNSTVLALLGISAVTTTGGNLIDKNEKNDPNIKRGQDKASNSFFIDLLSDKNGLSISRFQSLLFNLFIGIYFIYEVIVNFEFPVLDTELLVLMGISSGTYLLVKNSENKDKPGSSQNNIKDEDIVIDENVIPQG